MSVLHPILGSAEKANFKLIQLKKEDQKRDPSLTFEDANLLALGDKLSSEEEGKKFHQSCQVRSYFFPLHFYLLIHVIL